MEFWGIEVKSGEPLMVEPEDETVVHLSQACLGDVKGKGSEPVYLYASIGGQKLVIGILSSEKFPQVSFDLVFEKKFELSHNLKSGSVYFTGYKTQLRYGSDDDSIYSVSDAEEGLPINEIGKPGLPAKKAKPATVKPDESKPNSDAPKQKVKNAGPNREDKNKNVKDDDNDAYSEDDKEDDSSEDQDMADASEESSAEDEDEDDSDEEDASDEEEPPKVAVPSKKREVEPAAKTSASDKKAKFVTPQKTDDKKPYVHVATPYPKQALKAAANKDQAKQQTPNSSEYACKSCNRSFKSDQALQSHNKAKHASAS